MHGNYIKKLTAKKYNKTGNKQGPRVTKAKNETYIRPRVSWMLSTPRLSAKMTLMSAAIPPKEDIRHQLKLL